MTGSIAAPRSPRVDGAGDACVDGLDRAQLEHVRTTLLEWFRVAGSELPWRRTADAYHVLVSEFMLQQTQRERVIPKYLAFVDQFPTLASLAAAPLSAVIRAWAGLGYNSRAVRLHTIARTLARESRTLPDSVAGLRSLPGIGEYTAAAVACFGFGQQVAMVDTNVRRVLRRVLCGEPFPEAQPKRDALLAQLALPQGEAYAWNSALMDLGARVCLARAPRCGACPLEQPCRARPQFQAPSARLPQNHLLQRQQGRPSGAERLVAERPAPYAPTEGARAKRTPFAASDRYLRGRIVAVLRELPDGAALELAALALAASGQGLPGDESRVGRLAERLVADGLLAAHEVAGQRAYRLAD